jgi:hypothetical protein
MRTLATLLTSCATTTARDERWCMRKGDIVKNEEPNTTTHEWPTVTTADE